MITRSQMRRQLRAQGGIMNVAPREKFGIGSSIKKRLRKLIPNEIADVAVKAAPFVAMIPGGAPYAAAMRGIGRFDQRGSISDALKQGALTYGFGEYVAPSIREGLGGLRDRASNFFQGGEKPLTRGKPEMLGDTGGSLNEMSGALNTGTQPTKSLIETGTDFLSNKVPGFGKLNQIVQEKLLVGGVTGAATYIYEKFLAEEPPQNEGETYEQYMARRKENVGKKMRTYMDNYFANEPEYMQLDDAGRDAFVARYNVRDGGRIGYQTGGVTMGSTLQQNIASNRQQAAGIQAMLNAARAKAGLPTVQAPQRTAPAQTTPAPSITKTVKPISTSTQMIAAPMGARQLTQAPTMQQISSAMLSGGNPMASSGSSVMPKTISAQTTPTQINTMPSMPGMKGSEDQSYQPGIGEESLDKFGSPVDPLLGSMDRPIADFDQPAREDALYNVQSGSGKFTDLKRTRDPSMDPNFMNLSPQEQDKRFEEHVKSMEAFDKRFGSFADGRTIDPVAGRSSYRDILNVIQNDYPEAFKQLKGDETLAELDNLALKLGGYDQFDLSKTSQNPRDEFGNLIDMSIQTTPTQINTMPSMPGMKGGRVGFEEGGTNFMKWLKANYGLEVKDLDMDEYSKLSREYNNENPDPYETGRKKNAAGGIMSMPMGEPRVNQGGVTELDYRAKGGFVPVGIKEKADDVPAMLSKNEFVFTADAVRGAGNGSIEKGAQKMYDTMKNLERRVT